MNFDDFLLALTRLRVDRSNGAPRPYKPLLVAAVVLLIHKGKLASREVYRDGALESVFGQLLVLLYPDWPKRETGAQPFRHLATDGVWTLVPKRGEEEALAGSLADSAAARSVLRHVSCARLPEAVFARLAGDPDARIAVLRLLAATWFPPGAEAKLFAVLGEDLLRLPEASVLRAAEPTYLTERAVEEHLEVNWAATPFAEMGVSLSTRSGTGLPGRQVLTPVNTIDLLGFEAARNRWWVIELKRARTSDAVVGQVSRYMGWLRSTRAERGETTQGAVVVGSSDAKLVAAVKGNSDLSLWEYDRELTLRQVA